jgi:hypothetical protein
MTAGCLARGLTAARKFGRRTTRNSRASSARDLGAVVQERTYWDLLKAQASKPYDMKAIVAFAVNRDWRSPDAWFCDKLVAAGLEQVEVVPKLAPTVNRLDVRGLYLVVSAIAPVNS